MNEVAKALWSIITDFGVPKICQSDNGPEFVNKILHQLMQLYGIDHRLITAYNPRADGLVERKNKEVSRLLKKCMQGATDQWQQWLPMVQLCLNLKILERTGTRPFDLFFGRSFNSFGDYATIQKSEDLEKMMEGRIEDLKELRDLIWPAIAEKTAMSRKKRTQWIDKHVKQVAVLKPGTQVMAIDQTRVSKWDPIYEGPYTIIRQTEKGSYVLRDHDGKEIDRHMAIHMLKIVDGVSPSEGGKKKQKEESYEVSGILNHRKKKGGKGNEYLVRWKGCKEELDTWEPETNFNDLAVVKGYWKQRGEGKIQLPQGRGRSKKRKSN
jgi:hypothetical protein